MLGFKGLSPRSSKITVTKEKERRKRKSEDKERRTRENSNGCTLSFYNGCFGDCFWPKKHFWTEKVHLAVTFPKMTVDEPNLTFKTIELPMRSPVISDQLP